jgi:hypothetical protein
MKKIIALTCLLSAFVLNAKAEIKTLFVSAQTPEATYEVKQYEYVTMLNASVDSWTTLYIKPKDHPALSRGMSFSGYNESYGGAYSQGMVLAGPLTITIKFNKDKNRAGGRDIDVSSLVGFASFDVRPNGTAATKENFSLVLPEGDDSNKKLVLESSTDLVNWKAATLGNKTPSQERRFYRLRAVKE